MAIAALAGIIAMLAIYVGAVIVATQHVADRHSPYLIPVIARRSAPWIGSLAIPLLVAGVLALVPSTPVWEWVSFGSLVAAVAIALWRSAAMWADISDGAAIVSWVRHAPDSTRLLALEELFWNATARADRRVIVAALDVTRRSDQTTRAAFLAWLGEHLDLLSSEWLTREVLEHVVVEGLTALREPAPLVDWSQVRVVAESEPPSGDGTLQQLELPPINPDDPQVRAHRQQETYNDHLTTLIVRLLEDALNAEAFGRAAQIIKQVGNALAEASPWTQAHADLLDQLGYVVWNVGEPGASIPRTARIPAQLGEVEGWYSKALRDVWDHLQTLGDLDAVEAYALALGDLAGEVSPDGLSHFILPRIYDVLEDGFKAHLLTRDAIEQLASNLGQARHVISDDKQGQQRIDSFVITLGAMLAELGADASAVSHLLANGYLTGNRVMADTHQHDWLQPDSYAMVARLLK